MTDGQEQTWQFRGTLTEAQHCRIQNLASRKLKQAFWLIIFVVLMISFTDNFTQVRLAGLLKITAIGASGLLFAELIDRLIIRWQARHVYRSSVTLRGEVSGAVSESGIEVKSVVGQVRYQWDQVFKARIAQDVALIYTSPRMALYLMKTFFESEAAWEGAMKIIRQRAKKVKRA